MSNASDGCLLCAMRHNRSNNPNSRYAAPSARSAGSLASNSLCKQLAIRLLPLKHGLREGVKEVHRTRAR